jgi:hypothetical protein
MHRTIAVFTEKSAKDIISSGGSGAWVLNPKNAKTHDYLVCCRKVGMADFQTSELHGSAFLVGRIRELISIEENERRQTRFHIALSEYASIERLDVWKAWRNPVRYSSLEELGIDKEALSFVPMPPSPERSSAELRSEIPRRSPGKLTISEAKQGLAEMFGVTIDDVEITIRA